MNDRLKFRCVINNQVKDIHYFYELPDNKNKIFVCTDFENGRGYFVSKSNLMQCSGLRDKNGQLIYEGDIVTFPFGNTHKNGIVEYSKTIWDVSNAQIVQGAWVGSALINCYEKSEIIGNIYENPELLEVKND